jgi:hypothetical protein
MKAKIYKTIVVAEFLSNEPLDGDESLSSLIERAVNGDLSAKYEVSAHNIELSGLEAVKEIKAQGSDPSFFMLDEQGNETDY